MKASLLLIFGLTVYASAGPILENVNENKYERFMEIVDDDGVIHSIDLEAQPNLAVLEKINRNPDNNVYSLYTRQNPTTAQILLIGSTASIEISYFNPEVPTVVIAHGWFINQKLTFTSSLRDAFLETNDVNVIVVDWTRLSLEEYVTAAAGTPAVGRGLGLFLQFLVAVTGASLDSMHLVGFNLGAHLVGNAGRHLDGKVARITGLDPSGPLWTVNPLRLAETDAAYVEVIHTDGGVSGLGIGIPIGRTDFFANGGISQPGCLTSFCEHNRSWELMVATVRYNHLIGNACTNMAQVTLNTCRGTAAHMGNDALTKVASGMYRVNTGRIYPY